MTRISGAAEFALSAAGVYFTDDSLTSFFDDTDKLMSNRPIEPGVTTRDLKIRVANARQENTHRRFFSVIWFGNIAN